MFRGLTILALTATLVGCYTPVKNRQEVLYDTVVVDMNSCTHTNYQTNGIGVLYAMRGMPVGAMSTPVTTATYTIEVFNEIDQPNYVFEVDVDTYSIVSKGTHIRVSKQFKDNELYNVVMRGVNGQYYSVLNHICARDDVFPDHHSKESK